MRFIRFLELLIVVAIVAAIYAPPIQMAIESRLEASGTSSPINSGWSGTSEFVSLAREEGYKILIANSTLEDLGLVNDDMVYVVLGPDSPFTADEAAYISASIEKGRLSFLIAQGNSSNNDFFLNNFGFIITGHPIIDPLSSFEDNRVTEADIIVESTHRVIINVASPIVEKDSDIFFDFVPIGFTGTQCYDLGNFALGARIVAGKILKGEEVRGIVLSDSGILINSRINSTLESESSLLARNILLYLTQNNRNVTIVIDNDHYLDPEFNTRIPFTLPPLGMLLATFMISFLETFNQSYDEFLRSTPFPIILALSTFSLLGTYYGLRSWMGRPKGGFDTPDFPIIESSRLIESKTKEEIDVLKSSGEFYPKTLTRLYYILDDLMKREYGVSINSLTGESETLVRKRIGAENFLKLERVLRDLQMIRDKTEGRTRFIFPPIFSWRRKFMSIVEDTDQVLKSMGTYLMDTEDKVKGIEYRLRKR